MAGADDLKDDLREFRRAQNDTSSRIHGVELEVRGASGKLDLIFLAQTDHETRIRSVERAVVKFAVYAAIIGAALSIVATQIARRYMELPDPPARLADQYLDDGRRRLIEARDADAKHRTNVEGPK